jgi:hypothetical protein
MAMSSLTPYMEGTTTTPVEGPPLGNAAMQGILPPLEAAIFISVKAMASAFPD